MKKTLLIVLALVWCEAFSQTAQEYFEPLKFRSIGPFRGGRSVTASGVIDDPLTYYMGTTGGGLWKTKDAGHTWHNISDGFFKTGSVGAVAVAASNSNIVYCGMGEHAPRGVMTSYGDGVYKSTDAGKTWKHIGLAATQHISRIIIHPTNPDIVFVAAQGALYGPNADRGVYKSTDGGKTWRKVLYVSDLSGAVELSMVTETPEVMYAAMWHHQRTPWQVISGGEGSGLHKSVDGGETWQPINEGLPKEKGKMAIAVSQSNPDKVYALIESDSQKELGGLFVSGNAGKSWSRVSDNHKLIQRAWYYIELFVNPQDENHVFVLSAPALKSIDGGVTWEDIYGAHGDYHDLWINPKNPKNMVMADDGGASITFDGGSTWTGQNMMPTGQFYRINTDNLFPYNIYSGQQDNTSIKIASMALGDRSITERHWSYSAGGESAFLAFDPDNPRYVMGGSYLGTIELLDTKANAGTSIMAAPIQYLGRAARDMKYLYNWNAPIIRSQHEENTFYHCAQHVLRTRDNGQTWEEISPDLTRNIDEKQGKGGAPYTVEAVGAENYGTISYIIESPYEKGVFVTGSDDGLVYITKNGGDSWTNITPKGLTECLINAIEVSPHDPATLYIATTRYKFNDYTPAIYKSTNYGQSWTNISSGIPYGAFTRVVREHQSRKGLLFAGTETGLYISWNAGASWEPFQLNLPITPITDLKMHQGNLVVATSGRAFWILDDMDLLAQYSKPTGKPVLYAPAKAIIGNWGSALNSSSPSVTGTSTSSGVNPANGVVLYYELPVINEKDTVAITIKDADGNIVRTLTNKKSSLPAGFPGGHPSDPILSAKKGLNRFVWDMRHHSIPGIPNVYIEANFRGHKVSPGKYTVTLKVGKEEQQAVCEILANPLYDITPAQYAIFDSFMKDAEAKVTDMHNTINRLYPLQSKLDEQAQWLEKNNHTSLKADVESLKQKLKTWDEDMVQRLSKAYDDVENFENKFTAEYLFMVNHADSSIPKVNEATKLRKQELDKQWEQFKTRATEIIETDLPALNKKLWDAGIGALQLK